MAIDTEGDHGIGILVADNQEGTCRINSKVPRGFALGVGMAKGCEAVVQLAYQGMGSGLKFPANLIRPLPWWPVIGDELLAFAV